MIVLGRGSRNFSKLEQDRSEKPLPLFRIQL